MKRRADPQEQHGAPALDPEWITSLRDLGGDSDEFLNDLLGVYVEQSAVNLREISATLLAGGTDAASRAVHALGGSSRNVGAMRLGELCSTIEHDLENEARSLSAEELAEIETEHRAVLSAIELITGREAD